MTDIEQKILTALDELDTAVKTMRTSDSKPNLMPIFQRLDTLAQILPPSASHDLRHCLQRKSYEKARLILLGRGAGNQRGSCAR